MERGREDFLSISKKNTLTVSKATLHLRTHMHTWRREKKGSTRGCLRDGFRLPVCIAYDRPTSLLVFLTIFPLLPPEHYYYQ